MPLLLILFIGSGCAALIYEIVWFQLLQLIIGSSSISLGINSIRLCARPALKKPLFGAENCTCRDIRRRTPNVTPSYRPLPSLTLIVNAAGLNAPNCARSVE